MEQGLQNPNNSSIENEEKYFPLPYSADKIPVKKKKKEFYMLPMNYIS